MSRPQAIRVRHPNGRNIRQARAERSARIKVVLKGLLGLVVGLLVFAIICLLPALEPIT